MILIESSNNAGFFKVNGLEYTSGVYSLNYENAITEDVETVVSLVNVFTKEKIVNSRKVSEFTGVTTLQELTALLSFVGAIFKGASDIGSGFASYVDTQYTAQAPFNSLAGVPFIVPNNAGNVIDSQKPDHIVKFYDELTSKIPGLNGDGRSFMFYWKCIPTALNAELKLWLDIGTEQTPIKLYEKTEFFRGANEKGVLYGLPVGYNLNTWEANSAILHAESSVNMAHYGMTFNFGLTHKAR